MGENTAIEWTDDTHNFWWGCHKVSEECRNCYISGIMKRGGYEPFNGPMRTSAENWKRPGRWNRKAEESGKRRRIFTCSMSDFFHPGADAWRAEAWAIIRECRHLDWLILTKRPELIRDRLPADWGDGYANCWLGTTVGIQSSMPRVADLLAIPARVRFLSCEPLLGPVDLLSLPQKGQHWDYLTGEYTDALTKSTTAHLDWVIAGGESGPGARPMHPDLARSLRDQCQAAGVPFFFKQWGEWWPIHGTGRPLPDDVTNKEWSWVSPNAVKSKSGCEPDALMIRVGKKLAGRLLEGREWNEFPREER